MHSHLSPLTGGVFTAYLPSLLYFTYSQHHLAQDFNPNHVTVCSFGQEPTTERFSHMDWTTMPAAMEVSLTLYHIAVPAVTVVSSLRRLRLNSMTSKLGYQDRASFSRMTTADAQAIITYLSELEFPTVYFYSVAFALFKVMWMAAYCIPSAQASRLTQDNLPDLRYTKYFPPTGRDRSTSQPGQGIEALCRYSYAYHGIYSQQSIV